MPLRLLQAPLTGIKITGDFQAEVEGPNPPEDTRITTLEAFTVQLGWVSGFLESNTAAMAESTNNNNTIRSAALQTARLP
jgi:hypothetical protein